jgi:hypothetical protein
VSTRRKVAEYPVARLDFDAKLAKQVHTRKQKGESIKSIAADLNLGLGRPSPRTGRTEPAGASWQRGTE